MWQALIGPVTNLVSSWQERKKAKQAAVANWETAALSKSTWFMRLFAAVHIIGPIDYAFYLAIHSAWPLESPEEVAKVISTTLSAFPTWWSGAAITILLAAWGIREHGQAQVQKANADTARAERANGGASHRPEHRR